MNKDHFNIVREAFSEQLKEQKDDIIKQIFEILERQGKQLTEIENRQEEIRKEIYIDFFAPLIESKATSWIGFRPEFLNKIKKAISEDKKATKKKRR